MMQLFLAITFSSLTSLAGISSVGHGGGFAEMKMFEINLQLSDLAALCLEHSACEKTAEAQAVLQNIIQKRQGAFTINTTCVAPNFHHSTQTHEVSVDSCLLYGSNSLPKNYSDLLEIAMQRRLMQEVLTDFNLFLRHWKTFVVHMAEENQLTTPLWDNSMFEKTHSTELKLNGKVVSQKIYIETTPKTYDVTAQILKEFNCKTLTFVELPYFEIIGQDKKSVSLRTDVNVVCNSQPIRKRIYASFRLSQDETLTTNIRVLDQ